MAVDPIARGMAAEALAGGGGGGGGSGGGVLVVTAALDSDTGNIVMDKTWQEIHDALLSSAVIVIEDDGDSLITISTLYVYGGEYYIDVGSGGSYTATSPSGYPVKS